MISLTNSVHTRVGGSRIVFLFFSFHEEELDPHSLTKRAHLFDRSSVNRFLSIFHSMDEDLIPTSDSLHRVLLWR